MGHLWVKQFMEKKDTSARGGLLRSSIVVSGMTMISRVFGLARDMVIAYLFGASAGADAFFLAFKIPNFFRRLFAEGAFAQAFVPVLSEYKEKRSSNDVRALIAKTSGSLGIILLIFTLLGVAGAGVVVGVFAPGFVYQEDNTRLTLAVDMLRLTFPYLMLISLTAVAGSVLNTYQRFAVPSITPVLLNISLIGSALLIGPHLGEPVMALAWGVLIAGVAQLTFQLPFLAREHLLVAPRIDFKDEGVRRIGILMLPAIFGASVGQINLLLDTVLASFLETGSLSWLYYSDRLLELPLALFGIAIATVILPGLSKEHASEDPDAFSDTLNWAIRLVLVFGLPATAALVFLADELIASLFYQGALTPRDVQMAGYSLAAYGAGLLGHMLVKVLAPGYFARQDTRTPVRYGVIALVSNMVLNLILVWHFAHVGLALATSIAAFINAGLLMQGLIRSGTLRISAGLMKLCLRILVALVVMIGVIALMLEFLLGGIDVWFAMSFPIRLIYIVLICLAGALSYAATLFLAGVRPHQLER